MSAFSRPGWMEHALCRGQVALFLGPAEPEEPYFENEAERIAQAKAICRACPVVVDCLQFALAEEPSDGIWGGLTFAERTLLCPVCGRAKAASPLGCSDMCIDLRLAEYEALEGDGAWDVHVPLERYRHGEGAPSMRTTPYCVLPRGACHSSDQAYKAGCRCAASRAAKMAAKRRIKR